MDQIEYTRLIYVIVGLSILLILAIMAILILSFYKIDIDFKGIDKVISGIRKVMNSFVTFFDVPGMPWIIRVYFVLFGLFGIILVFSIILTNTDDSSRLYLFSTDSLKLILGAILGSLSVATERTWGSRADENMHSIAQERSNKSKKIVSKNSSKLNHLKAQKK